MRSLPVIRVNRRDEIVFVNDEWLDLLRETTGATDVAAAGVRGRPFADFAPDPGAAVIFRFVLRRVRKTQQPMQVPFRIEASAHRWHLDMQVLPLAEGEVECRYRTLLVEVPGPDLLTMCAWCQRVQFPEGRWARRQTLAENLDFFLGDAPRVTHGICPSCAAAVKATLVFT
jgi:hypothetical protein